MNQRANITLGATYKDSISKIKGVCTAHTRYLTGCDRVILEYTKDGDIKELWVDANRIELCSKTAVVELPASAPITKPGGPATKPTLPANTIRRPGFTLVELLVVITIVACIVALALNLASQHRRIPRLPAPIERTYQPQPQSAERPY